MCFQSREIFLYIFFFYVPSVVSSLFENWKNKKTACQQYDTVMVIEKMNTSILRNSNNKTTTKTHKSHSLNTATHPFLIYVYICKSNLDGQHVAGHVSFCANKNLYTNWRWSAVNFRTVAKKKTKQNKTWYIHKTELQWTLAFRSTINIDTSAHWT